MLRASRVSSISLYATGSRYFKAKSSSSILILDIPRRWARGAYTSSVSFEIKSCFARGIKFNVRILCSLSASFMRMTLISFAMARNILRRFSACISSLSAFLSFGSLVLSVRCRCFNFVTPSTRCATSSPNSARISSMVMMVSSSTSWSSPAAIVSLSSSSSASTMATHSGCMI